MIGNAVIVYTVSETDGTDADSDAATPVSLRFSFSITDADPLTFGGQTIPNIDQTTRDLINTVLPAASGGVGPLEYMITGTTDG